MAPERLQKILAQAGYGSRRACEEIVKHGRVHVNDKPAKLGDKADAAKDRITVDFKPIRAAEEYTYVIIHKPRGVVSSLDAQGDRPTVRELIPMIPGRLYPVGRLDMDSEGLVLMTNDGTVTNWLTHPRFGHEKEYEVHVAGYPDSKHLATWRRGVVLEDGFRTGPAKVQFMHKGASGTWLRITMREGQKHQIRRIGDLLGLPVKRIIRRRLGPLKLGGLEINHWRYLTNREIEMIKKPRQPVKRQRSGGRRR